MPPDLVPCTVEKVAINAVLAGCRPEYLPVVLAAVEAACTEELNAHGVLATTWLVRPRRGGERPDRARRRDERRDQLPRAGQSRQRDDRPRLAARHPQRRWRPAGRRRPRDARPAGQGVGLLRRARGRLAVGVARHRSAPASRPIAPPSRSLRAAACRALPISSRARRSRWRARSPPASARHASEARHRRRCHAGRLAGARSGVPRCRVEQGAAARRARRAARAARQRAGARRGRHRRGHSRTPARALPCRSSGPAGLLIVHAGGTAGLFSAIIGGWVSGAMRQRAGHGRSRRSDHERPRTHRTSIPPASAARPPRARAARRPRPGRQRSACSTSASRAATSFSIAWRNIWQPAALRVVRFAKPTFTKPAPLDLRQRIATDCQVVIQALAD